MAADQRFWRIWSEDARIIRKCERSFGPGERVGVYAREWTVPMGSVRFARPLSDEERARRAERARAMRGRL
jgi:hypothetical protein